jgi:hypothetical protein
MPHVRGLRRAGFQKTPNTFNRMMTPIGTPQSQRMMLFMKVSCQ